MADDLKIVKIEWSETHTYAIYAVVPVGFQTDEYRMDEVLAEFNEDVNHTGCTEREVDDITDVHQLPVPRSQVEQIDWEDYRQ